MTAWRLTDLGEADWLDGEAAVARYDALWSLGRRPRIEDFLPPNGPLRLPLLIELILTERELSRPVGRVEPLSDYFHRFPELSAAPPEALRELLADEDPGVRTPPQFVGPYTLEEEIGRGGFAVVYRARHRDGTLVALKLAVATGETVRLRTHEAEVGRRLDHSAIPPVLDEGQADGFVYLAHRLIEGEPLHRVWERRPPTLSEVADVVATVADAVHHAHQCGVVHQDIKASNVLLDRTGRPHLIDFGLALLVDSPGTQGGRPGGTAGSMAPEQVLGQAADARSDVWGLGVLLYEGLTGRVPFLGPLAVVLRQVIESRPLPPRQLVPTIPAPLEAICLRALARRPEDRYSTAAELAEDLRRRGTRRPVSASIPGRRKPHRYLGSLAALALLLVGLAGWHLRSPAPTPSIALVDPISDHWLPLVGASPPPLRLEILERILRAYAESTRQHPHDLFFAVQAATVRGHLADQLSTLGRPWEEVLVARQREVDAWAAITRRCAGQPLTEHGHAAALYCLADWLRRGGRQDESKDCFHQAEQRFARLTEEWGVNRDWAEQRAANVSPSLALWWRRTPDAHWHRLTVTVHRQAAEVALARGDYLAAIARARRALLEANRRFHDSADRLVHQADAVRVLGQALTEVGRHPEACDELVRVVESWKIDSRSRVGETWELRRVAIAPLHEVARHTLYAGLLPQAEMAFRRTLTLRERLAADPLARPIIHLDCSATSYHLAQVLERQSHEKEAENHYRTALDEHLRGLSALPDDPHARRWLPDRYRALALLLTRQGRADEASRLRPPSSSP
ncbi:MAG: serine/threonine-protein kinase [Gemmataceae bacterium]